MKPEERFIRIENALHAIVETQARYEAQFVKHSAIVEKQNAGIRDLVVVSRTLVDAQQAADKTIQQLIRTVDRLANTVDTLVKSFQKPNGIQ